MLAASHYVLLQSLISSFFAALFPRPLGRLSPNFVTCLMMIQIYKIRSEIWGLFRLPLPPGIWRPKYRTWNSGTILDNFTTLSRVSPECNKTSSMRKWRCKLWILPHRQTKFGVYFGPQTAKNRTGVLTHPPAIVQRTGVNNSVPFASWARDH